MFNGEYSLSLVLQNGNYAYVLASGYYKYEGKKMDFEFGGSYDFSDLVIEKQGEYKLAVALTHKMDGKEYVVSALCGITLDYSPFSIADTVTGYKTSYTVNHRDGELYILAMVIDIEPPKMTFTGTDKEIVFTGETPLAGMLIDYYEFSDNEKISSIKIYDYVGNELSWRTPIDSGTYTIIVRDSSGNIAEDTLTVTVR